MWHIADCQALHRRVSLCALTNFTPGAGRPPYDRRLPEFLLESSSPNAALAAQVAPSPPYPCVFIEVLQDLPAPVLVFLIAGESVHVKKAFHSFWSQ